MRFFVTGATGFIGSAVVSELRANGHEVLGLVRSDDGAGALARLGVAAHRGELTDLESLASGARACDGVIHTAFIHDWSKTTYEEACATDQRAIDALAGALEGSGKPLVVTSGTATLASSGTAPGRPGTEEDARPPDSPASHRAVSETATLAAARRGIRASVVRLPPTVHGAGDRAFVPTLIAIARRTGVAAFVGDGANRWPAVHRLDAARLFRLALEHAAAGARLHGVAEEGIAFRTLAEAIGAGLGVPVRGLAAAEAAAHFGGFIRFAAIDNPTSSALTRASLGWRPEGPALLDDLRDAGYFAPPA